MDKDAYIIHKISKQELDGFINLAELIRDYIQRDIVYCNKTVLDL
jgi:hypothetical protein